MKKKKNFNQKKIYFIWIILILIFLIIFFVYKNLKNGNTMINKSDEEVIEYVLNIKNYEAQMDIIVNSNKNENKYKIEQRVESLNSYQKVIEPQNIAGMETIYDGTNLKLKNNKIDTTKTYENYSYLVDNSLWLDSFINDYKSLENKKQEIKDNEIILEVKIGEKNKYNVYKRLYIDKSTEKPMKLIVQDINKNTIIYILYNKIEISK